MLIIHTLDANNKSIAKQDVEEVSTNPQEQVAFSIQEAKVLLHSEDFQGKNVAVMQDKDRLVWQTYYGLTRSK